MQIYKFDGDQNILLKAIPTAAPKGYDDKNQIKKLLKNNIKTMAELQNKLYAQNDYSVLLVFQAMDAAGKDSMIRRVMSGLNPQGTQVFSFKQPSKEEQDHDYLWRAHKAAPERGRVGIFNRSYYEEVLVVRVHNLLNARKIPKQLITKNIWQERFDDINRYEDYMVRNGQVTLKFYLNISKDEQKQRFLSRIDDPAKNWKFSANDLEERELWDEYQSCYQDAIFHTGTKSAPWFVIPSDNKWYARLVVSKIIVDTLEALDLDYPKFPEDERRDLEKHKKRLMDE